MQPKENSSLAHINVGVDVGGTFTDFILVDTRTGSFRTAKVPTTVDDRASGFMQGIHQMGVQAHSIDWLVHGTTAGTNAVLERQGARCGLITTQGFRDVLELGRRTRPYPYGLSGSFDPLIERRYRLEVRERIDAQGNVLEALNEEDVRSAVKALIGFGVESVVIHFLHSYANPGHEIRCAELVRSLWPNSNVIAGHEIIREMREFERGSTAAIHAMIRPIVTEYIDKVSQKLRQEGFQKELLVMQANGGMMAASVVGDYAVHTIMSGPAAGVLAAAEIAKSAGIHNVITGDMGGTSYDVALIVDGSPVISAEKELSYAVPVRIPMIDIHSIGSGGGSIAYMDKAGMLRVGPKSAGSIPGPIGYGKGGTLPTITDANFMLGRINCRSVTGSAQDAPLDRIAQALEQQLGKHLGLGALETAAAIIDIAVSDLAGAIRLISIDKGHDPRDFALMPYGGAGPLHAVAIARELGIPTIIVPRFPGLTSALGCVLANVRHDFVQTVNKTFAEINATEIEQLMLSQADEGRALLARENVTVIDVEVKNEVDLLYRGQSHVLKIPVPCGTFNLDQVRADFTAAYIERFDLSLPEMMPVLVNVRTTVVGVREPVDMKIFSTNPVLQESESTVPTRKVFFNGSWMDTAIYQRDSLPTNMQFAGPAIVEQSDTTLVLDPGTTARVDDQGNIVIQVTATEIPASHATTTAEMP